MKMPASSRIGFSLLFVTVLAAAGPAVAQEKLQPGRLSFEALQDRNITIPQTEDGRMRIRFKKDGSATVSTDAYPDFPAMWWVNFQGQLCLVSDLMWTGGRCYAPLKNQSHHLKAVRDTRGGPVIPITVK